MRVQRVRSVVLAFAIGVTGLVSAPYAPAQNQPQGGGPAPSAPAPQAQALAQKQGSVKISIDDAIQMALQHNHSLLATRTTIQQNESEEITANLRPNTVI